MKIINNENNKLTPEMLSFLQAEVEEMQAGKRSPNDKPTRIDKYGEPADVIS